MRWVEVEVGHLDEEGHMVDVVEKERDKAKEQEFWFASSPFYGLSPLYRLWINKRQRKMTSYRISLLSDGA